MVSPAPGNCTFDEMKMRSEEGNGPHLERENKGNALVKGRPMLTFGRMVERMKAWRMRTSEVSVGGKAGVSPV